LPGATSFEATAKSLFVLAQISAFVSTAFVKRGLSLKKPDFCPSNLPGAPFLSPHNSAKFKSRILQLTVFNFQYTVETLIIGPYFKFDWAVGEFSKIIPYFLIEINTLNIDQPAGSISGGTLSLDQRFFQSEKGGMDWFSTTSVKKIETT